MLKKSFTIAATITAILFGVIMYIGSLYGQYAPYDTAQYNPKNLGQGSRDFGFFYHEIGTASTHTQYFGTQSVTGSGTAGRIIGTSSALPYIEYNYNAGSPLYNIVGAELQNNGAVVGLAGSLTSYILADSGTGTDNVFTNTTLDGTGTLTATLRANGVNITPTLLSYLENSDSEIESHFTTVETSVSQHAHAGTDSVRISHDNVTGTGTNSHSTIDTFIASKASASGLASLDSNSLVVQNPASGTTTPAGGSIAISDVSGKFNNGWLNSTVTLLGQSIELGTETTGNTNNISEGDTNLYYLDSRVDSAVGSLSVNALSDVNITLNEGDMVKISGGQLVAGSLTASVSWSGITGNPLTNGSISVEGGGEWIPVGSSTTGKLDNSWMPDVVRLVPTTEPAVGEYGQWYVGSSSSNSLTSIGTNTTALMTSYTAPSPNIVSASSDSINQEAWMAFDRNSSEKWTSSTTTAWLSYNYGTGNAYALYQYNIDSYNDAFAPKDWLFQGSNDNVTWLTLDSQTNQSQSGGFYEYVISVGSRSAYQIYRINITLGNDATYVDLGEMQLIQAFAISSSQYNTKYVVPNGDTMINVQSPGTATTEPSYIMLNGSTTIFGLGTTTAIIGTTTAYSGWFDGAVRATAFNVASSEKIKENIKPIKLKPSNLEAEGIAKQNYILANKGSWTALNEANYAYVGSDTATYIDTAQMDIDYYNYIELKWASDLNQSAYVKAVQKEGEKFFWQMFDTIQAKEWTPKGDPTVHRKGFVAEEMPDVVKGQDGKSVDPMSLIAYMSKVLQALKGETILQYKALNELVTTGTITSQLEIEDRIEVLGGVQ